MGQKVNPIIFRIGQSKDWSSKWFATKAYPLLLRQDIQIRKHIQKNLRDAGIERVEIERSANAVTIIIHAGKPGLIIGRGGQGVEDLRKVIKQKYLEPKSTVNINIQEVQNHNLSAALVCQAIIADLEKRMPFRRSMKQAIFRVMKAGAEGVRVVSAGRLNGVEIARTETLTEGSLPLHTIRADIDYYRGAAKTTYGQIGVRVWIYKGTKFKKDATK